MADSLRTLLSIAALEKWQIAKTDIKNAYLNAAAQKPQHIIPPKESGHHNYVWRLKKALYGLPTSGADWHVELHLTLKMYGLTQNDADPCIYQNTNLTLGIYVDDSLVTASTRDDISAFFTFLSSKYQHKPDNIVASFLGLDITQDPDTLVITLSAYTYCENLMKEYSILPERTVLPTDLGSLAEQYKEDDQHSYRSIIGKLQFIATHLRYDIACYVSLLAQFSGKANETNIHAAKKLLTYVVRTRDFKISYRHEPHPRIVAYSDASYASDHGRKSRSGYIVFHQGNIVSWRSTRQDIIALSSMEAELISLVTCIQHLTRAQRPSIVHCDNTAAIQYLTTNRITNRTKHIDVRIKWIQEKIVNKEVNLQYICSQSNIADLQTRDSPK